MKPKFSQYAYLFTVIVVFALAFSALLACGPAATPPEERLVGKPYAAQDAQPTATPESTEGDGNEAENEDPEPTEEPTPEPCPHTEGSYPNLDATLQDAVGKYERCELTETEAAAEAPEYHGVYVLTLTSFPNSETASKNATAVETWMDSNGVPVRNRAASLTEWIYAYVPVSKLGALSVLGGVGAVDAVAPLLDPPSRGGAAGLSDRAGDEAPSAPPVIPFGLKGFEPYPNLDRALAKIAYNVQHGLITEAEAVAGHPSRNNSDLLIWITVTSSRSSTAAWIDSNGGSVLSQASGEPAPGKDHITAFLPVSKLSGLSARSGVERVSIVQELDVGEIDAGGPHDLSPDNPRDQPKPSSQTPPTPTPAPKDRHGATAWQTTHKGDGIKVGIIDFGFGRFSDIRKNGAALNNQLSIYCYTSSGDITPTIAENPTSAQMADCLGNTHGANVTQSLINMAPDVDLFIARVNDNEQIRDAARWLSDTKDVDIISQSLTGYLEGLGNGEPVDQYSMLTSVDVAVREESTWVNNTGNYHEYLWSGPFRDNSPGDYRHDFTLSGSTGHKNYLVTHTGALYTGGGDISAEIRWNDTWGGSDCDMDLEIHSEDSAGVTKVAAFSNDSQIGRTGDLPLEEIEPFTAVSGLKYFLVVKKFIHPPTFVGHCNGPTWLHVYTGSARLQHASTGSSLHTPATSDNPGMLAVGAASFRTIDQIQTYSGRGPTTDGRTKPDVVGSDCGRAVNLGFCGTSQATPHVAGVAALVLDRYESAWGASIHLRILPTTYETSRSRERSTLPTIPTPTTYGDTALLSCLTPLQTPVSALPPPR